MQPSQRAMREIDTRDRTKEAFQELVRAELPGLYSLARRLVRDGAEDLVQETLLHGYRAFGQLKADAPSLKSSACFDRVAESRLQT